MKDSDLGIPARPGLVANGPAPQPPSEQEKRGPGRPAGSGITVKESNVKPLSTDRLIETKKELEALSVAAGNDPELADKLTDAQIIVSDIESVLLNRRKGQRDAK